MRTAMKRENRILTVLVRTRSSRDLAHAAPSDASDIPIPASVRMGARSSPREKSIGVFGRHVPLLDRFLSRTAVDAGMAYAGIDNAVFETAGFASSCKAGGVKITNGGRK
ncbi:MAG: hypothetical protein WC986_10000 [Elusimicrobiota bacterium]|jgi:hypothetical protein